jgi:PAS domain S-box-containing protein
VGSHARLPGGEVRDEVGDEPTLAAMLDLLPERVARYRLPDLTVLYCNAAKAADYGMRPEELIGRPLSDALPPSSFEKVRAHLAELSAETPLVRATTVLERPGEQPRWIEWVEQLLPGEDGSEVLSVGRDTTDAYQRERALAASEDRFRQTMLDAPIGMALVGEDHRLLQVNNALCELLGRTEEELLELTTLDVTHPDDRDADLHYGHSADPPDPESGLVKRYVRPDGSIVWGLLKVSRIQGAEADGAGAAAIIGQVVDITERIEREGQLHLVAEAEHLVAERLRQLDKVKNTFLTAVSHELRTPLTIVCGMAATLRRLGSSVSGDTRALLEGAIEHHADRLRVLLDELLDVDRLARGTLGVRAVDIELVELVTEAIGGSEVGDRTVLQAPTELRTVADPVQIERIVGNLLDNAAKYAQDGTIEVRLQPVGEGGFRLEVLDEGVGIAREDHERVFEPFHRSEASHPRPGTGVGLALVSEFARLHGGRAWVEPSTTGAHLVVEVPAPVASAGEVPTSPDLDSTTDRTEP